MRHNTIIKQAALAMFATAFFCVGAFGSESFRVDTEQLTSTPHRLSGTPELEKAANYVKARLEQIGVDEVIVQTFESVQTEVVKCELTLSAETGSSVVLPLQPCRPNMVLPPNTDKEGIEGKLIYLGQGRLIDFKDKDVSGAIAVLDYNCSDGWVRALRLGAKAVIFVKNGLSESQHPHFIDAPADVPRFYCPSGLASLKMGSIANIKSSITWKPTQGHNVLGFIRGTSPLFSEGKKELIIISANLDTFGEVPRMTPGARGAANCAGLLKIAAKFKANPPKRDTLIAFFDNRARGNAGARAFYASLETSGTWTIKNRTEQLRDELATERSITQRLTQPDPFLKSASDTRPVFPFVLSVIFLFLSFAGMAYARDRSEDKDDNEDDEQNKGEELELQKRKRIGHITTGICSFLTLFFLFYAVSWHPDPQMLRSNDVDDWHKLVTRIKTDAEAGDREAVAIWKKFDASLVEKFNTTQKGTREYQDICNLARESINNILRGDIIAKTDVLPNIFKQLVPKKLRSELDRYLSQKNIKTVTNDVIKSIIDDETSPKSVKKALLAYKDAFGALSNLEYNRYLFEHKFVDKDGSGNELKTSNLHTAGARGALTDIRHLMMTQLKKLAARNAHNVSEHLGKLRKRRGILLNNLKYKKMKRFYGEMTYEERLKEAGEISKIVATELTPLRLQWNAVRRALGRDEFETTNNSGLSSEILERVQADYEATRAKLSALHVEREQLRAKPIAFGMRLQEVNYQIKTIKDSADPSEAKLAELYTKQKELKAKSDAAVKASRGRIGKINAELDGLERKTFELGEGLKDIESRCVIGLLALQKELHSISSRRVKEIQLAQMNISTDQQILDLIGSHGIALHVSFVFGDLANRWNILLGSNSIMRNTQDAQGAYAFLKTQTTEIYNKNIDKMSSFELLSIDGSTEDSKQLTAMPYHTMAGDIAGLFQVCNISLGTMQESMRFEGTPDDLVTNLNLGNIESQVDEATFYINELSNSIALSRPRSITSTRSVATKAITMDSRQGGGVQGSPLEHTIVVAYPYNRPITSDFSLKKPIGYDDFIVTRSNMKGLYMFGPIYGNSPNRYRGFAVKYSDDGTLEYVSAAKSTVHQRMNMIKFKRGLALLPLAMSGVRIGVYDARGNTKLDPFLSTTSANGTADGICYWYCEEKVNAIKLFSLGGLAHLSNGDAKFVGEQKVVEDRSKAVDMQHAYGQGSLLPPNKNLLLSEAIFSSGPDIWRLNEARLEMLRRKGIINGSIEELHGRADDLLIRAGQTKDVSKAQALSTMAFLMESPVHSDTRSSLDDLVKAVLVLLALSIPFAFALERLLIGSTTIYKQVAGFAGFFVATFLLLYFSHPAFVVAKTPIIIFLGFAVLLLSSMVIVIIMRKFEHELKLMQGQYSTVHLADVSRFNTVLAAMSMGISTMRRRPLRTALTAITILLLTFTILGFASFGTQKGIVTLYNGPANNFSAASLYQVTRQSLPESLLDITKNCWGDNATTCPRYWKVSNTAQISGPNISRQDTTSSKILKGILGLSYDELSQRMDMARVMGYSTATPYTREQFENGCIISNQLAAYLDVKVGDKLLLGGRSLTVLALPNSKDVDGLKDLEGNSILPVDFENNDQAGMEELKNSSDNTLEAQAAQSWVSHQAPDIAIVSANTARNLGADLRGIVLYTDNTIESSRIAEEMTRMLQLPTVATRADGVFRHALGDKVEVSGFKDLLFPILLGGLVVFGTMLGSVADRDREIYTFSALGLAPPHVASLFFAEALIYSVLGGLGGYLLAQGSMKVLGILAGYGLVSLPEMNYSSTNAIVTIILVMITVILSSIYPALKASRSANPGVMRSWQLPQPEGDKYDIVFPFTVSDYDITGVVSFLKEHFDNYSETGLGSFLARDTELLFRDNSSLGLSSLVALAPFDLGVTQQFELTSAPSEIEGIDEVHIMLLRKSGQPSDWMRLNKVLLDDIRKQFLIWRSLPQDTMDEYRHRTLAAKAEAADTAKKDS